MSYVKIETEERPDPVPIENCDAGTIVWSDTINGEWNMVLDEKDADDKNQFLMVELSSGCIYRIDPGELVRVAQKGEVTITSDVVPL